MRLLLPLVLLLIGLGGGVGAGLFLTPPAAPEEEVAIGPCGPLPTEGADPDLLTAQEVEAAAAGGESVNAGREYARLNNQFVVPVVKDGLVSALVVLSISVEVTAGQQDFIFDQEPKLRDVFLQVLFDHANTGGFDGTFTASATMRNLRTSLRAAAQDAVGPIATDVLIIDIVRQDV